MAKYRIYYDIKNCTGAFTCVSAAPGLFVALPGGDKVDLVGGHPEDGNRDLRILDIEESTLDAAMEAANVCPSNVLRVVDLESGITLAGPEQLPIEQEGQARRAE